MSDSSATNCTAEQFSLALISHFEGFRDKPYQDGAGVWTIGYGTTRINGWAVGPMTPQVTRAQAQGFLLKDMATAIGAVSRLVRKPQTYYQLAALISFTYNVGTGHFANSTLLKQINEGVADPSPNFLNWDIVAGKVSDGLITRRRTEQAVYQGKITYSAFIQSNPAEV